MKGRELLVGALAVASLLAAPLYSFTHNNTDIPVTQYGPEITKSGTLHASRKEKKPLINFSIRGLPRGIAYEYKIDLRTEDGERIRVEAGREAEMWNKSEKGGSTVTIRYRAALVQKPNIWRKVILKEIYKELVDIE